MYEWVTKPLKQLAALRVSNVDKKSSPFERPVRLCNYMDVYSGTYLDDGAEYMEATASQREVETFSLQQGDVIITKDSETPDDIGIPAMVDTPVSDLVCGYHLAMLRPFQNEVRPAYLMKQLQSDDVRTYYAGRATGSTRYALSTRTIEETPIPWVHPDVQEKIAAVLRVLDIQIEQTEALIAKQEQVRAGLMQDLFTRGVDKSGRLRPPRREAPELYHETELGWLPKGWEIAPLRRWAPQVTYGFTNPMPTTTEGPYMITAADVRDGAIDYENCRRTSFAAYESLLSGKSRPSPGDILLTKDGTLGRIAVVGEDVLCVNQSVAVIKLSNSSSAGFFALMLQSPPYQRRLLADAGGSTIKHLYITVVAEMLIAVPREEHERLAIVQAAGSVTSAALKEQHALERLCTLRGGLMQDLLTGKIPVDALLKERAAA